MYIICTYSSYMFYVFVCICCLDIQEQRFTALKAFCTQHKDRQARNSFPVSVWVFQKPTKNQSK